MLDWLTDEQRASRDMAAASARREEPVARIGGAGNRRIDQANAIVADKRTNGGASLVWPAAPAERAA